MTESHRVAIIGAGPIGLELAVALKQAGVDYVQLDAGQIGTTISWYPLQMYFHSNAERLAIAGVPIQLPDQQKPKREEYLAYLRAVVQQFGLEVRTFERVELIERSADGQFILRTRAADGEHRYMADNIVLAIGAMHAPRLLGIPGEDLPHVSDPEAHVYESCGLKRGGARQLFAPRVFWRGLRAALLERHGAGWSGADVRRMPGAFLIEQGRIIRAFRHATSSDRPHYATLCRRG